MTAATTPPRSLDLTGAPSVLWKAFDVLGAFSQSRRALTLSEIARKSGLPKSTVHRVLSMLVEVKAVDRVDLGYRMGLKMFAMATCSAEVELRDLALPHLERLRRATGQTVHLAVRDEFEVVYLEKLVSPTSIPTPAVVGGRLPVYATGVGKALLAFADPTDGPDLSSMSLASRTTATLTGLDALRRSLHQVREAGIATDREEAVKGLACLAAPVLINAHPVAAVSVAFPAGAGAGHQFESPLREATATIARAAMRHPTLRTSLT